MIGGGSISGNSASGRPDIAINPPITVTIAITIATIGLLMKNLEIIGFYPCNLWMDLVVRSHECDGFYDHSGTDFHRSFRDYCFARVESLGNEPHRAAALADFHRAKAHLIVWTNNRDLIGSLQLRHRSLRHHQRILLRARHRTHSSILTRSQTV